VLVITAHQAILPTTRASDAHVPSRALHWSVLSAYKRCKTCEFVDEANL
jgi:hypothetical protein